MHLTINANCPNCDREIEIPIHIETTLGTDDLAFNGYHCEHCGERLYAADGPEIAITLEVDETAEDERP